MTKHGALITFFSQQGKRFTLAGGMPRSTLLMLSGMAVGLIAIVGVALRQEVGLAPFATPAPAVVAAEAAKPKPLSAEEEAFAEALFPLHQEVVEPAAGRLTSAGLAYAVDDHDAKRLAAKLAPLRDVFHTTHEKVAAISAPASLQDVRDRYLELLSLYEQAAVEMLEVARDGDEGHLINAQQKSGRAAEYLVKVGDILWPGEHKPN